MLPLLYVHMPGVNAFFIKVLDWVMRAGAQHHATAMHTQHSHGQGASTIL
jgi:hypothetical protein